ncbi:protein kinase domain-containing protein [Nonomuraea sp. ZG12]|uniref:serine/threonine-protein kinase n=1 Tax=Nonomuraea sp. ZG12 TaxID=3452207 RepID=UPI003F896FAC
MVPGYRDVRQLGEGRTGRVFLSTYQATGAYVAVKYLNATLRRDAEFMRRYRADAAALVELDDPAAVKLHEYVETSSRAAVVMELVDGVSLRALLAEHGPVSPEAGLALLKTVLNGLAAAHEKGVAHRDVRPENVFVQADGACKLSDFGIVVHVEEPGVPAGSPAYMSPELWTLGAAGPPADLYAAACLLFEAVRGRPPYQADDVPGLRDRHLVEPVPVEIVPDPLRGLLSRGLAKDPTARYASARQFAAELERDAEAGYGPDWEKRGRRNLAEPATLLALHFPLARPDSAGRTDPVAGRTGRTGSVAGRAGSVARGASRLRRVPRWVPIWPPYLWVAWATVAALAATLMMSGGRLPPSPGTVLLPPPESTTEPTDPEPDDPAQTSADSRPDTPARTSGEDEPGTPADASTDSMPPDPTGAAPTPGSPTTPPATSASATPTGRRSAGATPRPAVQAAGILSWSGSEGSVRVTADGPGQVRLRISYMRRDGDGPAREMASETRTLTGRTSYTSAVRRDLGAVACGERAHLAIVAMTEPAAANGPQISEVTVTGPDCATPSATGHPTSGHPTPGGQSPTGTPPASQAPAHRPATEAPPATRPSAAPIPARQHYPTTAQSSLNPIPHGDPLTASTRQPSPTAEAPPPRSPCPDPIPDAPDPAGEVASPELVG